MTKEEIYYFIHKHSVNLGGDKTEIIFKNEANKPIYGKFQNNQKGTQLYELNKWKFIKSPDNIDALIDGDMVKTINYIQIINT